MALFLNDTHSSNSVKNTINSLLNNVLSMSNHHLLFEMANVTTEDSHLPVMVYISPKTGNKKVARIKVSNLKCAGYSTHNFSLTIADEPKIIAGRCQLSAEELAQVKRWVQLNQTLLLQYWHEEMTSTKEVLMRLQGV